MDRVKHTKEDDTTPTIHDRDISPERKRPELLKISHGIQDGVAMVVMKNDTNIKSIHLDLRRMEKRICEIDGCSSVNFLRGK